MNRLKKVIFALAVAVGLGLLGATDAQAKLNCTTGSTPTLVRSEGTIEFVGKISLSCTSDASGTVAASITVAIAPLTATIAPPASTATLCGAGGNNTSSFPLPTVTSTDAAFDPAPLCSVSGNTATLSFTAPTDVAQTITISGIRVNIAASGLAAGAGVSASMTVSPTATNQISITNPTVIVAFAFASTFTSNTVNIASCGPAITTPATAPGNLPLGNPDPSPVAANSLKVTMTEGFATAWQLLAADDGGTPGLTGTRFRIQLTGIPSGFTIYAPAVVAVGSAATNGVTSPAATAVVLTRVGTGLNADGSGGASPPVAGAAGVGAAGTFDKISISSGTATIVYEVTANDGSPVVNTATIFIAITGTATTGTGTINRTIGYAPVGPPTTAASRPQFVAGTSGLAASVNICATYLLFPWVAYTGDGAYDTGFAISNTTADPAVIGTTGQTGDVTLYFWRSDGTNNPSPVTVATGLTAGRTTTYVLSQLGSAFTGYAIAVCNFQLGHGFAFINNPSPGTGGAFAQGYLALSVTSPRLGAGQATAIAGGTLESAGH